MTNMSLHVPPRKRVGYRLGLVAIVAGATLGLLVGPSLASAAISFSPSAPKVGGSVRFDSNLPTGPGYSYRSLAWDLNDDGVFGDGGSFFAVTTTFATVGDHRVRVRYDYTHTTCSGDICTSRPIAGTDTTTVTIYSGAPQVSVAATPNHVQVGQPAQIEASAQQPPGDTTGFAWSTTVSGVLNPFTSSAFTNAWATPGSKTVTATARTRYSDPGTAETHVVVGPDTTLDPLDIPAFSPRTTAQFRFGSSIPNVAFMCRLDAQGAQPWERPCTRTTVTSLADGPHRFELAAIAPTGEVDPSPVAYDWTVDTQPPETNITGPPDGFVDSAGDLAFNFGSPDPSATFQCSVDQGAFAPCAGDGTSTRLVGLPDGPHALNVRAVDRAGNADATPARRSWLTKRPTPLIDADGDGDPAGHDCDDHDARRATGRSEIAQDGLDEDCDGHDGAFPTLATPIHIQYGRARHGLRVTSLTVERPPAGTRIEIRCRGNRRSCRRKRVTRRIRTARRSIQLRAALANRELRPGTVIEVRVRKPEALGRVRRDRITTKGAKPQILCLDPRRVGQRVGFLDGSVRPRAVRPGEQCG